MASEIRVNKLNSSTGVGTITLSPTGVDISGVTTVSTLKVGTGVTASEDGDIFATGVCTATSFSGDGSSLTGIAATDNVRTGILDVAGVGTFRGDVNIPDKIIHLGDTNTSIRFPAADTFTVETAGDEHVRIASNGNITYSAASGENTIISKRTDSAGSNGNYFFHLNANNSDDNTVGSFGFHRDTATDDSRIVFSTRTSGGSNTERLRITSTGNFGLATDSPVAQTNTAGTALTPVLDLKGTGSNNNESGVIQFTRKDHANQGSCIFNSGEDGGLTFRNTDGNGFGFYNGTTNAFRIKTDGKIGINCTPDYLFNVVSSTVDTCRFQQTTNNDATSYSLIFMKHAAARSGSNGVDITFQNDSGTTVGMIDHGQSTTQYRTSSDYRLKENAEAISDGITRLKTLKPYRFNWISEPGQPKVDGFFAHEVTSAVPEAISGTKDETENILYTEKDTIPSGKKVGDVKETVPRYQGIDQSKLVPLLTAALQEAVAKIEVLETRLNNAGIAT